MKILNILQDKIYEYMKDFSKLKAIDVDDFDELIKLLLVRYTQYNIIS